MNLRARELLDFCYEFDCQLRIPSVCHGGRGEPCHANWAWAGKGGAMKAHDCFVVPGCRACHSELDQGKTMSGDAREGYWLRAFGKFFPALFERGLITAKQMRPVVILENGPAHPRPQRRRKSACTVSAKQFPRHPSRLA